jgi:hypothetical protein
MSTTTIQGTITANIAEGGPAAATYIGSPKTNPTSSSLTITQNEGKTATLKITSASGVVTVSLDSVSSGTILYVGCNYQTEITVNGNSFTIGDGTGTTTDGGFVFLAGSAVTTLTVEAQLTVETTVTVVIYGD